MATKALFKTRIILPISCFNKAKGIFCGKFAIIISKFRGEPRVSSPIRISELASNSWRLYNENMLLFWRSVPSLGWWLLHGTRWRYYPWAMKFIANFVVGLVCLAKFGLNNVSRVLNVVSKLEECLEKVFVIPIKYMHN